jgi:hypothetical protein
MHYHSMRSTRALALIDYVSISNDLRLLRVAKRYSYSSGIAAMKAFPHIVLILLANVLMSAQAHASAMFDFSKFEAETVYDLPLTIDNVTFTSGSGLLKIVNLGGGNSLCAFDGFGCFQSLSLNFEQGVTGLRFGFSGDETADSGVLWQGETADLSFIGFKRGDGVAATVEVGSIRFDGLKELTFSPLSGTSGVAFNSFSYDAAEVPEPLSQALTLFGLAMLGLASTARRRDASGRVR